MSIPLRVAILLCFFLNGFAAFSQNFHVNVRKIGMIEGLSHYRVLAFYPEKEGMWIGTEDGLDFYNGFDWKHWKKEDRQLSNKNVNFIHRDQQNLLWLFSTKHAEEKSNVLSIDILDEHRKDTYTFKQKFGDSAPFSIAEIQYFFEDKEHNLFFFANDKLWKYTSALLFEPIELPEGFMPQTVFSNGSFAGRVDNKFALVAANGAIEFQSDYILNDDIYQVKGDDQKFWVWHSGQTLKVFEPNSDGIYESKIFPVQPDQNRFYPISYINSEEERIWITQGKVIYLYDFNGNQHYSYPEHPRKVCIDNKGNVWMGKYEITILQLQPKRFEKYIYGEKEVAAVNGSNQCRGILELDKKLYINTYGGLGVIDLESAEMLPEVHKKKRGFAFLQDQKDQIWMAWSDLVQLNPISRKVEKKYQLEKGDRIWSLFEDRNEQIWLGGDCLYYLEKEELKKFDRYNEFVELKNGLILFFFKDKNGVIWLGSNEGLFQLDLKKGIIAGYGKKRNGAFNFPTNKFQHMYQDSQGIYWLTTEDAGLLRWNKATGDLQQFDKEKGMPTDNIYSVYEDAYGYLWLSSFNGIIRFHKRTQDLLVFNEEEGITDNEFNRISHYQASDGQIYFGGQNGVTAFHPKNFLNVKSRSNDFELDIKHISVVGHRTNIDSFSNGDKIVLTQLGPEVRVLDLEIEASDMFWTDKIALHYNLQKLNQAENIDFASRENISFDNHIELFGITPGRYNLRVRAIQNNGKQIGSTFIVPINIGIPIFQQPIFWGIASIGLLIGIWLFMKFRTSRLRKRQRELETMVTERAHEILKNQQTIKTQAEEIETMKVQLNRKEELWLEQFQSIINERLGDPDLYLPDIIDNMNISRSMFYEKVKALTQMTPNQYIQELRLAKAKTILDQGEVKTVKEVAQAIGIKRPSYFSKLYKERYGILPSSYFREYKSH